MGSMRKPGRASAADLAARYIGPGSPPPLRPPSELTESEARSFAEIVSTVKPGHFQQCDVRLLSIYCQALTLARRTGEAAEQDPGNASPALIKLYDAATRRVCSLATKLRLTPISRSPQKSAATNDAARPASYYEYWNALQGGATEEGWKP
jgi:phage terminase small subunit